MQTHVPRGATLAAAVLALFAQASAAYAQSLANCSRLIAPKGQVTWICPPATAEGGRWRGQEFIPACPPGLVFSRDARQCMNPQNVGGVLPCSADDRTFIPGRGWVSNCPSRVVV